MSRVSNGNAFDVSNHGPVLTRLWLTSFTQFRTTFYGQIFKGSKAMHITREITQFRTVNNMEHLKMSHSYESVIGLSSFSLS
ncbi:hypothetical protein VNO77_17102 [Canavalia gladiata]|uniref:Uncharacterized protein n=1 Tax=Canavalia gladiata TaxID=3824 RepID=A0AAN9QIG4_CANGL